MNSPLSPVIREVILSINLLACSALATSTVLYLSHMQLKIHKLEVTYNVKEQQRIIKVWIACDIFDDLRANYFTSNLDVDTW